MLHQSLPSDFKELLQNMKETVLLTEEPVSVLMKNALGEQPLHLFAIQGNVEGVARCVEFGADIDAPGEHDFTALHEAATQGQVEVVKLLLQLGANPNAVNAFGETPAEPAANLNDDALIDILRILGAAQCGAAPQPGLEDKR